MKLVYIRSIGETFGDKELYELIFAKSVENVDGEGWDSYPASGGEPQPPAVNLIDMVGRFETDKFKLKCINTSDSFAVWDAVDGVVAMAWEDITEYQEYPEDRIKFFYGDELSTITDLLYDRDIIIDWRYDKRNELKG
jgi:hypothetical protein